MWRSSCESQGFQWMDHDGKPQANMWQMASGWWRAENSSGQRPCPDSRSAARMRQRWEQHERREDS